MAKTTQDFTKLREKDAKALRTELSTAQADLQKARVDLAFGRLKDVSRVSKLRKQVARIQTLLHEKERSNA